MHRKLLRLFLIPAGVLLPAILLLAGAELAVRFEPVTASL